MGKKKKNQFYAFFIPQNKESGITETWKECELKVRGVPGARFMGFESRVAAKKWLEKGAEYETRPPAKPAKPGIYFDAGTGRGKGVEVRVTDEKGKDLLTNILPPERLTKHGTELLGPKRTNNYGELLGCFYAIQIALQEGAEKIFGDSALVINYWSKGTVREKQVSEETVELAKKTADLRKKFEEDGGKITRISGSNNPADLGFH